VCVWPLVGIGRLCLVVRLICLGGAIRLLLDVPLVVRLKAKFARRETFPRRSGRVTAGADPTRCGHARADRSVDFVQWRVETQKTRSAAARAPLNARTGRLPSTVDGGTPCVILTSFWTVSGRRKVVRRDDMV
jgi:hypothetical protein